MEECALGLRHRLGFPNGIAVGAVGGLALFCRGDVIVASQSKSKSHIDVLLSCATVGVQQWRLTGFYGQPRRELRKESWYLMRFLMALCGGLQ